jgi:hypothetical protein
VQFEKPSQASKQLQGLPIGLTYPYLVLSEETTLAAALWAGLEGSLASDSSLGVYISDACPYSGHSATASIPLPETMADNDEKTQGSKNTRNHNVIKHARSTSLPAKNSNDRLVPKKIIKGAGTQLFFNDFVRNLAAAKKNNQPFFLEEAQLDYLNFVVPRFLISEGYKDLGLQGLVPRLDKINKEFGGKLDAEGVVLVMKIFEFEGLSRYGL